MKNYGMPFKNSAIDKMSGKFGKDNPTNQNVDFKANAQKRIEERNDVRNPMAWNDELPVDFSSLCAAFLLKCVSCPL